MDQCARRMNKRIDLIPGEVMAALIRHDWPGNIRELQNFIERAVILSRETMLLRRWTELKAKAGLATASPITLEQAESSHILHTLRETNWVIGGPKGAAARLGIKRTTLISQNAAVAPFAAAVRNDRISRLLRSVPAEAWRTRFSLHFRRLARHAGRGAVGGAGLRSNLRQRSSHPNNAPHTLPINLPTPVSSFLLLLFFTIETCTVGI